MSQNWSDIRVTPGSRADARLPAALERSTPHIRPDLLADSFVRLAASAVAPWDDMLRKEPALVAAQILAFRLDDEVQRFDLANEKGPKAAVIEISQLARTLRDWLTRIREQLPDAFGDVLKGLDQQMGLTLRVRDLAAATVPRLTGVMQNKGFVPPSGDDPLARARAIRAGLGAAHKQMVHAIAALKPVAQLAFDARLHAGTVEPATGLILAELAAAQIVDDRLNRFTRRHADFYYADLIGQTPRGATAERALLHLPSGATPKLLPKNTGMIARLGDGTKIRFNTETDVPVTPAKVVATAGLTYETDQQVSLFSTLGAITGVRAAHEPADTQPLNRSVFVAPATPSVDMGLDISSQMFALSEGHRELTVALHMNRATDLPAASPDIAPDPSKGPDPDIALELRSDPELIHALGFDNLNTGVEVLVKAVHDMAIARGCGPSMDLIYEVIAGKTLTVEPLRLLLGRIVTLALVENHPWPRGDYWTTLENRIIACQAALTGQTRATTLSRTVGDIVEAFAQENGEFIYAPADLFEKMLGDAFSVTLSTADGALPAKVTRLRPIEGDTTGLLINLTFTKDMPAIAPLATTRDGAPQLRLRWDPKARVCPVSFFERYTLEKVGITVKVDGLRHIAGFGDDGAVAPGQAFMPFGIRPTDGATFTIASPEMAQKPVTNIRLDLRWADLPDQPGGFETHYQHYPKTTKIPEPMVTADYLSGDGWKPVLETPRALISVSSYDRTLQPDWHMQAPVQGGGAVAGGGPIRLPKSRAQIRAGAIRLTMTGGGDFGQAQYPLALVDAMRPRLVPVGPRRVPAAPYIPKIESLRLGYTASASMTLAAPDTAHPGDRITQVTPFGRRDAFPGQMRGSFGLFPARLGMGTLFIQLAGAGALRQLGILFDIADSGHLRLVPPSVPLVWHYLTGDGWAELPPTAIASDTTDGLLRSGVITLDLPDDARSPADEMSGEGVWIAISAPWRGFETHPTLSKVRTNGVWAVSAEVNGEHAHGSRDWRFELAQPGMSAPKEANRRAPPRPPEARRDYLARISERLRHRARAVTPYDIERLILEAFPDVWRVKCLPHLTRQGPSPKAGVATVVVVRHPPDWTARGPLHAHERLFDAGTLEKIRAFLHRHGSPNAQYEVVNPAFDRLHVRASVRFVPFRDDGAMASKLQRHLVEQLSVWTADEDLSRFGWSLNVPMLRARIADLDDVLDVTDFSVLHFTADDTGSYALADTAQSDHRGPLGTIIRPSRPWALPLSSNDHAIASIEKSQPIAATQSGIGRLQVGEMLIVGQGAPS